MSYLKKALLSGGDLSLAVLETTSLVNEFIARHSLSHMAAQAIGRTATACAYLCSWLKSDDCCVYITVSGDGTAGKISVSGDGALRLRGNVERDSDGEELEAYIGRRGTLAIVRDEGEGFPVVGTSELKRGDISSDFEAYFLVSEQRPTAICLDVIMQNGVCVSAGGAFLQPMPGAGEEALALLSAARDCFSKGEGIVEFLSSLLERGETCDMREIKFGCRCSRKRAEAAVLALGKENAMAALEEQGELSVHCHDCNTDYLFRRADLDALFGRGKR